MKTDQRVFTLQSDDQFLIFNTALDRNMVVHTCMLERRERVQKVRRGVASDEEVWTSFPSISVPEWGLKYGGPFDIETHEVAEKIRAGVL